MVQVCPVRWHSQRKRQPLQLRDQWQDLHIWWTRREWRPLQWCALCQDRAGWPWQLSGPPVLCPVDSDTTQTKRWTIAFTKDKPLLCKLQKQVLGGDRWWVWGVPLWVEQWEERFNQEEIASTEDILKSCYSKPQCSAIFSRSIQR